METLNEYRRIIRELIQHYAQFKPAPLRTRQQVALRILFVLLACRFGAPHNAVRRPPSL
jgi:hypothetical protein